MEQLLEILEQLHELSGVAVDAVQKATGGSDSGNAHRPEGGADRPRESAPPEQGAPAPQGQ